MIFIDLFYYREILLFQVVNFWSFLFLNLLDIAVDLLLAINLMVP